MTNRWTLKAGYAALAVLGTCLAAVCPAAEPAAPPDRTIAAGPFQPSIESLKKYRCPDWFRDAKFGIWAHWGPQAVPMEGDWYARNMYEQGSAQYNYHVAHYGHPSKFGYKDVLALWKAEKWDPDQLMALYKKAGARYFVSQAVHCDNFDLWNSKFHKWNAVAMGPKRDIVGDWQKAALKQGLPFGVSEHVGYSRCWFQTSHGADKTGPLAGVPYDGADPQWQELYHPPTSRNGCAYSADPDWHQEWFIRMRDLVDQYHPDFLYTDGGIPFGNAGLSLVAHLYNTSIAGHGGKLEAVYTSKDLGSGMFAERASVQDVERGLMPGISPLPWQSDTSNGDWYCRRNDHYKTAGDVIGLLADIVSKNGNLLLNVVQYPDGSLPPESAQLLADLAPWMASNGEAIYATRPWQVYGEGPTKAGAGAFQESYTFTAADIRFTQSKDGAVLYALALGWPADGKLTVRRLARAAGKVDAVALLGSNEKLNWQQTDTALEIALPATAPCKFAVAFKISGVDLKPAPVTVLPQADGAIALRAGDADIHGPTPMYGTDAGVQEDKIGFWSSAADFVSWDLLVIRPGRYKVSLTYACDPGAAGSEFALVVGATQLAGKTEATASWKKFATRELGVITIDKAGLQTATFKPRTEVAWKAINLHSIRLEPLANGD